MASEREEGQLKDDDLIQAAIHASGLSLTMFATHILRLPEPTVQMWWDGDETIPEDTRRQLQWFISLTEWERDVYVDSATFER